GGRAITPSSSGGTTLKDITPTARPPDCSTASLRLRLKQFDDIPVWVGKPRHAAAVDGARGHEDLRPPALGITKHHVQVGYLKGDLCRTRPTRLLAAFDREGHTICPDFGRLAGLADHGGRTDVGLAPGSRLHV